MRIVKNQSFFFLYGAWFSARMCFASVGTPPQHHGKGAFRVKTFLEINIRSFTKSLKDGSDDLAGGWADLLATLLVCFVNFLFHNLYKMNGHAYSTDK